MVVVNTDSGKTRFDTFKWILCVCILLAGWLANTYYAELMLAIRLLVWILLLAIAGFIAAHTAKGAEFLVFLRESRIELYKVIWPTRQETLQTTLVVIVIVLITGAFLWGVDSMLLWAIGKIAGSGVN